jgi:large subunit ribosomal protein L35
MKTRKGLKKRVKLTESGKIKRVHANIMHNAGSKSKKQKRRLHSAAYVDSLNMAAIKNAKRLKHRNR